MRARTEAEIKAYADGYNACYKQFCECLKENIPKWKVVKKMGLFVTAVTSCVEVADTPQTDYPTEWCEHCELWREDNCIGVAQCKQNIKALKELSDLYEADTPQKKDEIVLDPSFAELSGEQFVKAMKLIEPQTDCAWMYDSRRDYEYDKALDEMERNFVEFEEYDDGEDKSEEVTE